MRRYAQWILATGTFIVLVASPYGVANAATHKKKPSPPTKEDLQNIRKGFQDELEKRDNELQKKLAELENDQRAFARQLGSIQKQIDALRDVQDAQKTLPGQLKELDKKLKDQIEALLKEHETYSLAFERTKNTLTVELALTALLAAVALLLGLLQLRTLRSLMREQLEKPKPVDGRTSPLRALPHSEVVSKGVRDEEAPPPPPSRHEKIAALLDRLQQEAPRLAAGFGDSSLRERFLGEYDAPLSAILERLRISEQAEDPLEDSWLGPDLVPTLNGLARFYSEAVAEGRQGHSAAKDLAVELRAWLYDRFSPACSSESWFSIDPIEPYVTGFDPKFHQAVAGSDVDGAAGKIIAIQAIGRRDPQNGDVIHKAEVIVGR